MKKEFPEKDILDLIMEEVEKVLRTKEFEDVEDVGLSPNSTLIDKMSEKEMAIHTVMKNFLDKHTGLVNEANVVFETKGEKSLEYCELLRQISTLSKLAEGLSCILWAYVGNRLFDQSWIDGSDISKSVGLKPGFQIVGFPRQTRPKDRANILIVDAEFPFD